MRSSRDRHIRLKGFIHILLPLALHYIWCFALLFVLRLCDDRSNECVPAQNDDVMNLLLLLLVALLGFR